MVLKQFNLIALFVLALTVIFLLNLYSKILNAMIFYHYQILKLNNFYPISNILVKWHIHYTNMMSKISIGKNLTFSNLKFSMVHKNTMINKHTRSFLYLMLLLLKQN